MAISSSSSAHATSLDGALYARNVFQSMAEAGRGGDLPQSSVFEFLKLVALNKRSEADPQLVSQVGFDRTELLTGYFGAVGVRAEAFRALGILATEEAQRFLKGRIRADIRSGEVDLLWPVIRTASYQAQLAPLSTDAEKFRFLESVIQAEHDDISLPGALGWASNQLCDAGALVYLPTASIAFRRLSRSDHESQAQFCQERMWVVASHSDRPTALASALTVENAVNKPRLVNWAIRQLKEDRQPGSAARVDAYLKELIALPRSSPMRQAALYNVVKSHIPPTQNPGIY